MDAFDCLFLGLFAEPIFTRAPLRLGAIIAVRSQSHFFFGVGRGVALGAHDPAREAIQTLPSQRFSAAFHRNHH